MKDLINLLSEYALNLEFRRNQFKLMNQSTDFDILKHEEIPGLELAIMRGQSIPHYHTRNTFFCFASKNSLLILGGLDKSGIGHVSKFSTKQYQVYPIPAYTLHAAGPKEKAKEILLLVYTPSGDRPRSSEYPDDTIIPEKIEWI